MPRFQKACALGLLFAAALISPGLAQAAAPTACPPFGQLPGYKPDPAKIRQYDTMEFYRKAAGSDDLEPVTLAGRTCVVDYAIEEGKDPMSDLEIHKNYQLQLEAMGAEIVGVGGRGLTARLTRNGAETWMSVYSQETSIQLRVLQKQDPRPTLLAPTAADFRLLGRMPNYTGDKPVVRNYDQMDFTVRDGDEEREVKVQGKTTVVHYAVRSFELTASNPEVQFNYRDALTKMGAEILYVGGREITARVLSNGQVVWVKVYCDDGSIQVSAVEEKPFEPSIKPAQDSLRTALDKAGRVALYVNFDFAKATLRPEAAPVVAQVLALLKADPNLKLSIEGHTDNLGTAALNRTLSQDRAASLVASLVAQGIAPGRLVAAGFGADKPVASNDTSEGRARNRRVELVKM